MRGQELGVGGQQSGVRGQLLGGWTELWEWFGWRHNLPGGCQVIFIVPRQAGINT
ncbi:hypothetical protein GFS31_15220 [Leptolyngbya sp. BL0902]|nr:hypothetical protein GFS31_15220 [Leptolyngbya sp. BL0902]